MEDDYSSEWNLLGQGKVDLNLASHLAAPVGQGKVAPDPKKWVVDRPPEHWVEINSSPGYWMTLPHKKPWKPNWFRKFCMWALFDMVWKKS